MTHKKLRRLLYEYGLTPDDSKQASLMYINLQHDDMPEEWLRAAKMFAQRGGIDGRDYAKNRTICQAHREIYRQLIADGYTDGLEIMRVLREAYHMGKKMNNKLKAYKKSKDGLRHQEEVWYRDHRLDGGEIDEEK